MMTPERLTEVGESIGMAVKMARAMLDGANVTAAEIAELQDAAKAEESHWHAVGPILDPTAYMNADADKYVRVHKRLQLAAIALAADTFGPEPVKAGA
jgi:Sec-independent protein translocase protein TatA